MIPKKVLLHVSTWIVFFIFILFSVRDFYLELSTPKYVVIQSLILAEMVTIFYINYFYLTPKVLLVKKRRILISILGILSLVSFGLILSFIIKTFSVLHIENKLLILSKVLKSSFESLGSIIFFMIISSGIRLVDLYSKSRFNEVVLREQSRKAELEALKAKINPHFLYNAFNTLYALSELKSDLMSDSILKLSNIMRYLLNNSSQPKVSIYSELDFITNFINFQKLRIDNASSKVIVNIQQPESDYSITPTLLISFIENAFKHSNLLKKEYKINFDFETTSEGFSYYVTNNIFETRKTSPGKGNENLKKILEIEYAGCHVLKTWEENELYHAYLSIKI